MKKTKIEKGITLVALIITIIVLLILAVTAISAVSDSGIIQYAKIATSKSKLASIEEEIRLIVMGMNTDIKVNSNKYTFTEEEAAETVGDVTKFFFVELVNILEEKFIIDESYILELEGIKLINYELLSTDSNRIQQIDDMHYEIKIPCTYKEYPIDIVTNMYMNENTNVIEIIEFDFEFTSNLSIAQISTEPTYQTGGNITSVTDDGVPIPKGFYYVSGTKDTGVVISTEENDTLTDTRGTLFVWVPVPTDPKLTININSPTDSIKTVQVLNTEGLNETFTVNSDKFNKEYNLTQNGAYEVITTYASGEIDDRIHYVEGVYELPIMDINSARRAFKYYEGITFEQSIEDSILSAADCPYTTVMEYLTASVESATAQYSDLIVEKDSVKKYGGFYILRNDPISTAISYDAAIAEINDYNSQIDAANGTYSVRATLTSSAAWDAIAIWLSNTSLTEKKVYIDSSTWGYYSQNKTGNFYANNIYKLAGGLIDWTTMVKNTLDSDGNITNTANVARGSMFGTEGIPSFYSRASATEGGYRILLYITD